MALLEISDFALGLTSYEGEARVLNGVSLAIERGEIWGLVGETGCGKSVTGLSISRLLPSPPARVISGHIRFDGEDILGFTDEAMRKLRGRRIGMIFQDPTTNLNPAFRIGVQMVDVALAASRDKPQLLGLRGGEGAGVRRRAARTLAIDMLRRVGIEPADRRIDDFPHEFSGGMRQRVLIAMALIGKPDLLIADEPTTALDVSVQAQVLKLMTALAREDATAVLFITHNLGVVAKICSHVAVMYAGNIVETGSVKAVFKAPQHPYTRALMAAVPKPGVKRGGLEGLAGVVPNLLYPPPGCRFAPRCHLAVAECTAALPALRGVEAGHGVACIMANASS
jgi:peptide/nickel transport system ATP-binding protein